MFFNLHVCSLHTATVTGILGSMFVSWFTQHAHV